MASGKKNYFRHSFHARKDSKLVRAMNLIGTEAYYFYFTLIEIICTELDGDSNRSVRFHSDFLKREWGINIRKLEKILRTLTEVSLIECVKTCEELSKDRRTFGKVWEIFIPNLSKYLGKYTVKFPPNTPNKIKGNKTKVNESKTDEKSPPSHVDMVLQLWREIFKEEIEAGKFRAPLTLATGHAETLIVAHGYMKTEKAWRDYFNAAKASDYIMGKTERGSPWSLTWAIVPENIDKALDWAKKGNTAVRIDGSAIYKVIQGNELEDTLSVEELAELKRLGGAQKLGQMTEWEVRRMLKL